MTALPSWLPPMAIVNPWTSETFDMLYRIFEQDFKLTQLTYEGCTVWFFPDTDQGKEVIFWHLTHREDKQTGRRLPDLRRSEKLPWIRKMIENPDKPEVLAWDYLESDRTTKTYVWLEDHDFLIIMKKYRDGRRRLITSYHVEYPHKRRKLTKKYADRIK